MDNQNNKEKKYLHVLGRELLDLIRFDWIQPKKLILKGKTVKFG